MFHINLTSIGPVVSDEDMFECVDGRRRTKDHWYTINLPCEPLAQEN